MADGWGESLLGPDGPPLTRWEEEGRLEAVKRSPHRVVWRVRLDPDPADGPGAADRVVFLKIAAGGRCGGVRSAVDVGRPFREAAAALRVAAAGVAAADPLLAGRWAWPAPPLRFDGFSAGPRWSQGPARALVTGSVEPAVPLPTLLAVADRLAPAVRRAVTAATGAALGKLHAAGLFPGDLHPGNLFLRGLEPAPGGGFDLSPGGPAAVEPVLIDLAPLHVRAGWPGASRRVARSLGMLSHGVAGAADAAARLRFLAAHREAHQAALRAAAGRGGAGLPAEWRDWVRLAEGERRGESARRHARRDRHWRRCCRGMRVLDDDARCVSSLSDADAARLRAACGTAVVAGRPVRATRLSPAAARRGWEFGHALRRRGVAVAEPVLCVQGRFAGLLAVAAGDPVGASPEALWAARRLCEAVRAWGYTVDGPHAADFQRRPDGSVELADPAALRRAGRDEPAPRPDFTLVPASATVPLGAAAPAPAAPALRRAA